MLRKGLLIIIVLLPVAAVSVTIVQAQGTQPSTPTYVGSDKCATCHKPFHDNWAASLHPKMIQDPAKDPEVILADLGKMSATPTAPPPPPTLAPVPPTDTPAPTAAPAPQVAPATNWVLWLGLAVVVVIVLMVLVTRKPKAS